MAEDKRLNLRSDLRAKIELSIIGENSRKLEPFEVEIQDISAGGLGFVTENQLMIGEIFKGVITIWTKQKINVVVKVVRSKILEEGYAYGCTFIGMGDNDSLGIKIYQMINEK